MVANCEECRQKLIEVARARDTIFYSALAQHLGVENRDPMLGRCLDEIYEQEIRSGRPDLTLVVVSKETGFGRFNSQGKPARSVKVDGKNRDAVSAYIEELNRVYAFWASDTIRTEPTATPDHQGT
jgi:hypothetical protein